MSSNATGDTQPEPAVIAAEPAAADVAGPSVAADAPEGPDAPEGTVEGAAEGAAKDAAEDTAAGSPDDERAVAEEAGMTAEAGTEADLDDEDDEDAAGPWDAGAPGDVEPVEEFRPGRRWPRVLLAVGFVMAAAAIVGGAIAIVGSLTHGFKKPVKVTYKKSAVFALKTGDCLDPQGQSYTLIACGSPHGAEVFATFKLPGTKWPGSTAAASAASSGCATRLPGYLNPELAISLASTYVYPDAVAWKAGTRTVICEVRASSGQLTGSVRGASATAG
jgi:hypothetical protein